MSNIPIITFSKVDLPWGFLSNMAPFPILYMGVEWKTAEALFQALRFVDTEVREIIRTEKSPMAAKMKAKLFRAKMIIEPTGPEDVMNMRQVLHLKFSQHNDIRKKLLNSGQYQIIEDIGIRNKPRDLFWGMRKQNGLWEGENTMGKLLMELRDSFIKAC
jgi:ribA/ribD-fused uncharacterized protein